MPSDTIFALSSGGPPAAIAVIRVSGPDAKRSCEQLCASLPEARLAALRKLTHPRTGELLDDALVLRFDGPRSATGEDLVELHCHGGRAVVDAVVDALASTEGLRQAQPGEFTRRAFENGRIDLTEAEGLADLLEAETQAQRRAALMLAEGGLRRQIEQWQAVLLGLSAAVEMAIDYADDEDDDDRTFSIKSGCADLASELRRWLEQPLVELLKEGIRVVIAGPPNVGKSSLFNALIGQDRAIVTPVAGTTRDLIEAPISISGVPFVLIDTAGLRETEDRIEAEGVARAEAYLERAELILWLGDPGTMPSVYDRVILVAPKSDLAPRDDGLRVSSLTGEGIDALLAKILHRGQAMLPGPHQIAVTRRQWSCLAAAKGSLTEAVEADDPAILADLIRSARESFSRMTGRAGVEDMLDALFGRFCVGK